MKDWRSNLPEELSDRGPRRYPKLRLRTRLRGTHLPSPRHALHRRSRVPDPRTNRPSRHPGSWRCENLPVPIVHDPEALRADLSVPSRTRWRPCESARRSKSPGRSTNHPENRCTIGAHDTVEFESPLQAAPKSGAPHRHNRPLRAALLPKAAAFTGCLLSIASTDGLLPNNSEHALFVDTPQFGAQRLKLADNRTTAGKELREAMESRFTSISSTTIAPPGRSATQARSISKRTLRSLCRLS